MLLRCRLELRVVRVMERAAVVERAEQDFSPHVAMNVFRDCSWRSRRQRAQEVVRAAAVGRSAVLQAPREQAVSVAMGCPVNPDFWGAVVVGGEAVVVVVRD